MTDPRTATPPDARVRAAHELLARIAREHAPAAFASSFGAEDMVLLDLIAGARLPIRVFTLDTGRLPQETHDLIDRARARYAIDVEIFVPQAQALEAHAREHGSNAFYRSIELRQQCCALRKREPLGRALAGAKAWITGLRRAQAVTREALAIEEYDAERGIVKLNPLADWSEHEIWAYLRARRVPWNALHDRGYPSIGCAPCTRAVAPGEDVRAGRWWWEQPEQKECGLHRRPPIVVAASSEVTA